MEKDLVIVQGLLVAGYSVDADELAEDEKPFSTTIDDEILYLKDVEIIQSGNVIATADILGIQFSQVGAIAAGKMTVFVNEGKTNLSQQRKAYRKKKVNGR